MSPGVQEHHNLAPTQYDDSRARIRVRDGEPGSSFGMGNMKQESHLGSWEVLRFYLHSYSKLFCPIIYASGCLVKRRYGLTARNPGNNSLALSSLIEVWIITSSFGYPLESHGDKESTFQSIGVTRECLSVN